MFATTIAALATVSFRDDVVQPSFSGMTAARSGMRRSIFARASPFADA